MQEKIQALFKKLYIIKIKKNRSQRSTIRLSSASSYGKLEETYQVFFDSVLSLKYSDMQFFLQRDCYFLTSLCHFYSLEINVFLICLQVKIYGVFFHCAQSNGIPEISKIIVGNSSSIFPLEILEAFFHHFYSQKKTSFRAHFCSSVHLPY